MSLFPLEEEAQRDNSAPMYDPAQEPDKPGIGTGMGFNEDNAYLGPLIEGLGSGAAKGEGVLAGLWHAQYGAYASGAEALGMTKTASVLRGMESSADVMQQDATARAKALTPDATTTGMAAQVLHGIGEGGELAIVGGLTGGPAGAFALTGGAEGKARYDELVEQGVDKRTAATMAGITGVTAGAATMLPGGFGAALLTKVATGAAVQTGLGIASRYADHAILEHAGYTEMAQQQKVLDGEQELVDAILGGGFGAFAHLHADHPEIPSRTAPGVEDAALTANLGLRDREMAPGVPVDPAAAGAHQVALEQALGNLIKGDHVDVTGSGIEDGTTFARREETTSPEAVQMIHDTIASSGLLDESAKLDQLEQSLGRKLRGEPEPPAPEVGREPAAVQTSAESEAPRFEAREAEPAEATEPKTEAVTDEEPTEELPAPVELANQALADRPDMEIHDDNGQPILAGDSMSHISQEVAQTEQQAPGLMKALADCVSRFGA